MLTGHHMIKVFTLALEDLEAGWNAPEGWKPFATLPETYNGYVRIVCRSWVRADEKLPTAALPR